MKFWDQTFAELFIKGGFAMWPLLICSVIGIAIMLERSIYFLRLRFNYQRFIKELKKMLQAHQMQEALLYCRKLPNPVPRIAYYYLENLSRDDLRNDILRREGSLALEQVESKLRGLAALTHISPLLGLLGTVTGLVSAFHKIELLGGQVQSGDLAAGIWEALVTTVFGLLIAIPCMAAYHGFESLADRISRRMQFVVSELDEFFGKKSSKNFKTESVESVEESLKVVRS